MGESGHWRAGGGKDCIWTHRGHWRGPQFVRVLVTADVNDNSTSAMLGSFNDGYRLTANRSNVLARRAIRRAPSRQKAKVRSLRIPQHPGLIANSLVRDAFRIRLNQTIREISGLAFALWPAERIMHALSREISGDVRFGLHVSVEADGGGDLGVRPGVRVVGRGDGVIASGPGSSQTHQRPGDLPVDPKATRMTTPSLYDRVRERKFLLKAWRVIRSNAAHSGNRETRRAAEAFEDHLLANIQNIQRRLKNRKYRFKPALGIAAPKGKGKTGKRAIVVATVADRVVQRAILDVVYRSAMERYERVKNVHFLNSLAGLRRSSGTCSVRRKSAWPGWRLGAGQCGPFCWLSYAS